MYKKTFPWHILVFLAPAFIIYTLFSAYPLIDTLRLSFFAEDITGNRTFNGIENYFTIFTSEHFSEGFWRAVWNNTKFFLVNMLIQNPIALLLAALLSTANLRGAKTYRTLIFLPTLLSVVIIGFVWKLILSPLWGVSETMMSWVGLEQYFDAWLGLESSALFTTSLISVWQWVGMPMMLIYAALLSIPEEVVDAAYVDGASPVRIFFEIKLPLIYPTLGLVTILTFVGNFNAWDLMYTLYGSGGGPGQSVDILGTYFYRTFFGYAGQAGSATLGSTIASLMFLVILIGVGIYFYFVQRRLTRFEL